jgi:molecular chaperone GrpE
MSENDAQPRPANPEHDGTAATPVADLSAELAATKDRLLRSLAEQENIRAQARRQQDEAVRYAAASFASDLLLSIDDLERAIASVPEDQRAEPAVASLLNGVEATRRALLDAFAKHDLKHFDPLGQPFDPHRHEASFEAPDSRYPPGTVTTVIRPGYLYCDRLLRPALVGVSKAPDPPQEDVAAGLGGTPPPKTAAP